MLFSNKIKLYKDFFFGSDLGEEVLRDLAKKCFYNRPLYDKGLDKDLMLFREGQRSVFLYIKAKLNIDDKQLEELIKREVTQ